MYKTRLWQRTISSRRKQRRGGIMKKEKWINFKKPIFIGVDYDCKFNRLKDRSADLQFGTDKELENIKELRW